MSILILPFQTPQLTVIDQDTGFNAVFMFTLSGPRSGLFSIHPSTGAITTNIILDLEDIGVYSGLLITATDLDGLESNASLEILVRDVNDHSPTFAESSINVTVSELVSPGFQLPIVVSAEDLDEGENGFVTYSFSGEGLSEEFEIDPISGAITVRSELDYETRQQYVLNITASDSGDQPRVTNLILTVDVIDENDNSPVFLNPEPTFNVTEYSSNGKFVGLVEATDLDSGFNSEIVYYIVAGDDDMTFAINSETGEIWTNGTIDREMQDLYTLIVEVRPIRILLSECPLFNCFVSLWFSSILATSFCMLKFSCGL